MNAAFYVYAHKRPSTGAIFYIGKGKGGRIVARHSRNPHWHNVVKKENGFDSFKLIENIDEEFAHFIEIEAIELLRIRNVKLVNVTSGGEGVSGLVHSAESRAKMSLSQTGKKQSKQHIENSSKSKMGHHVSEETRRKLSLANSGKTLTDEHKLKVSNAQKGRIASDETRLKMSAAQRGKHSNLRTLPSAVARAVVCTTTGERFPSATAAAKHFCGSRPNICKCCRGVRKSVGGHVFRYEE